MLGSRCPSCSAALAADARFCSSCGSAMGSVSDLPTAFSGGDSGSPGPGPSASRPVGRLHTSDTIDPGRFLPGAVIADRYRIVGLLGRGAMGEIFRADDLKLGQPIALKFLPERLAADPVRLARFHAEVRLARQVSHPNVLRVYDLQDWEGQPFLAMEYVDGEDLASLLKRIGRLSGEKALEIARQICAGLAAAHDRGVVHRDLKPANVMIDGEGRARIADFGLAAAVSDRPEEGLAGTLVYMAPEQLAGGGASVASDLYALGLVLYEIYTGRAAFGSSTLAELRRAKQEEPPPTPSRIVPELDPAIERVILRCLEREPRARPASALQVSLALPGGDPLAAALAAGETPSPEMVAAAGAHGALSPAVAAAGLAAALVALVAAVALLSANRLHERVPLVKPPDVLVDKARDLARRFGYAVAPHHAFGFDSSAEYLRHLAETERPGGGAAKLSPEALRFWYRESPRAIFPLYHPWSRAAELDPPVDRPGMVSISLDPAGRLLALRAVPPDAEPEGAGAAKEVDWDPLFDAAGLDPSAWVPVAPRWNPPTYADARAAWEGERPDLAGTTVRIEAASYRGKPLHFRYVLPWDRPEEAGERGRSGPERALLAIILGIILVLLGGAAVLARRNLVLGRGDRRGAFRLALFVLGTLFVSWLLDASHVPGVAEFVLFWLSTGSALFTASFAGLVYLAVEPYVRARWPQAIVSWTRVLAGSWRDPVVGRDVLVGCVLGGGAALLSGLAQFASRALALPVRPEPFRLSLLSGGLAVPAAVTGQLAGSVFAGLVLLFFLVLFRMAFRRTSLALVAFALIVGLLPALQRGGSWIGSLEGILAIGVVLWVLTRFGVLAVMVANFVGWIVRSFPVTLDASRWYAPIGFSGLAIVAVLALYGFRVSLGDPARAAPAERR